MENSIETGDETEWTWLLGFIKRWMQHRHRWEVFKKIV